MLNLTISEIKKEMAFWEGPILRRMQGLLAASGGSADEGPG